LEGEPRRFDIAGNPGMAHLRTIKIAEFLERDYESITFPAYTFDPKAGFVADAFLVFKDLRNVA
jgi:hypothetical protein